MVVMQRHLQEQIMIEIAEASPDARHSRHALATDSQFKSATIAKHVFPRFPESRL
jgi:hypothetical protein